LVEVWGSKNPDQPLQIHEVNLIAEMPERSDGLPLRQKQNLTLMASSEDTIISWQAPEFRHYHKSAAWYITLAVIVVAIIAFQLVQKDIFGAVSIFIVALFVAIFSRQKPQIVNIALTSKGLYVGDNHIPYKAIRHFWVVHNQNHKTLNLETTTYLNRTVVLELEDQDPEQVRQILVELLPEHESTEETLAQRLMHKLKF
jgi:hypothetical protein